MSDFQNALANLLGVTPDSLARPEMISRSDNAYVFPMGDTAYAKQLASRINSAIKATSGSNSLLTVQADESGNVVFKANFMTRESALSDEIAKINQTYGDEIKLGTRGLHAIAQGTHNQQSITQLLRNQGYNLALNGVVPPQGSRYVDGDFSTIPESVKAAALKTAQDILNSLPQNVNAAQIKELSNLAAMDGNRADLSPQELAAGLIAFSTSSHRDNLDPSKVISTIGNGAKFDDILNGNHDALTDFATAVQVFGDALGGPQRPDAQFKATVPKAKSFGGRDL